MTRNISNAELKARKKYQAASWRATGALGLTGAALGTGALVLAKKPGAFKAVPGLKKATPDKLRNMGVYTGLASGGIGGVGAFNSAKISQAESKKIRKDHQPKKSDDGFTPIGSEISFAKDWSPTVQSRTPEEKRHARAMGYQAAGETFGGAALATSAAYGANAMRTKGKKFDAAENNGRAKSYPHLSPTQKTNLNGVRQKVKAAGKTARLEAQAAHRAKNLKVSAATAALGAGGFGLSAAVHHKEKNSWKSY